MGNCGRFCKEFCLARPTRWHLSADGSLKSDPKEQAEALASQWAGVFSARPTDQDRIQQWLTECPEGFKIVPISSPGRRETEKAIRCSPGTAPGPDGIPFACWRGLKLAGAYPRGVPYFEPEGTRPFNMLDINSRIVANAIRYKVQAPTRQEHCPAPKRRPPRSLYGGKCLGH
jgi:hypothetical protein